MTIRECIPRLTALGVSYEDAAELRKCAMQLHSWHEQECGSDHGCIERDDATGKPFWRSSMSDHRHMIADREKGANARIKKVLLRYPGLLAYVQGDPRGVSLYILSRADVPAENTDRWLDSNYNRGVAVYR